MIAYFDRFEIHMTKEQAKRAGHVGDCQIDVEELRKVPAIAKQFKNISSKDIRAELKEYGAWDETELNDAEQNEFRILWIAAGNILEEIHDRQRPI